jgi:multiple sugar transport system permease protein
MLGIIGTVKVFDIVWVMTGGGPNNATQLLSSWSYTQAFQNFNFGQGAAIANMLLVISFVLALVYLRSLRKQSR